MHYSLCDFLHVQSKVSNYNVSQYHCILYIDLKT